MQIHVDHVESHVARFDLAHDRVQIGTVVVEQPACVMNDLGDLQYLSFKYAQSGRIGQHQTGGPRPHCLPQGIQVHVPIGTGRYFPDLVAAHGCGSRVGAMGGIRNQNFRPFAVAFCIVVGPDHGDAGELTLSAGKRAQRD